MAAPTDARPPMRPIEARAAAEPSVLGHGGPPPWLRRIGRVALSVEAVGALIYLFIPIVVVVVFSFNKPLGKYNYVWNQFSLDAWADPFKYPELRDSLIFSLKVAVLVTLISVILGTLIAMAMVKYRFKAKGVVGTLLVLPLTMPEVVMGFSLLTWFVALGTSRGYVTIVIAQVMFSISYVATTVRARIRGFDWRLEEAALADPARHRGRRPVDVRPVARRLHHHVPQLRHRADVPDPDLDAEEEPDPPADQRVLDHHPGRQHRPGAAGRVDRIPAVEEAWTTESVDSCDIHD
jgi:hypothetical protein